MSFLLRTAAFEQACGALNFDQIVALDGVRFRELDNRRTFRFERGGQAFFDKLHNGVGWGEIIKNLLQLRLPIISARNEWLAIAHLENIGVATMTMAACGERGWNPAHCQSFIITHELADMVSLEELAIEWQKKPPSLSFRRAIVRELARIARLMHGSGMNHRDFYLCHFLLPRAQIGAAKVTLHLIDLHRATIRTKVPRRWREKDLAGLYFSAMDAGFAKRDFLLFTRIYNSVESIAFWRPIIRKASALYQRQHRRPAPVLFGQ